MLIKINIQTTICATNICAFYFLKVSAYFVICITVMYLQRGNQETKSTCYIIDVAVL